MKKKTITTIGLFVLLGCLAISGVFGISNEPVHVGADYFEESCEPVSSNLFTPDRSGCEYYCWWCEPYNGDGACNSAASCC